MFLLSALDRPLTSLNLKFLKPIESLENPKLEKPNSLQESQFSDIVTESLAVPAGGEVGRCLVCCFALCFVGDFGILMLRMFPHEGLRLGCGWYQ